MSKPNTVWITVEGSGTPECDGLYCPSTAPPKVSESGTKSSLGYWSVCCSARPLPASCCCYDRAARTAR